MIRHPLSTEKCMRLLEAENKMVFVVDKGTKKEEIKKELEEVFKAKVIAVNTMVIKGGKKKAYVKFSNETPAIDIATKMGMM